MTDTTPVVPAEAPAAAANTNSAADAAKAAEEAALKVFAGNISFQTTEDDLKRIFSEAGTVTAASVITRGSRHLGYGFVTFATAADAQKAISTLNDREIEGRKIAVQAVKPENAANRAARAAGRESSANAGERKRTPKKSAARRPRIDEGEEETGGEATEGGAATSAAEGGAAGARPRARKPRNKKAAGGADAGLGTPAAGAAPDVNGSSGAAGATNGLGTPAAGAATTNGGQRAPRAPRAPRGPKGAPNGPPSETLLFVANLPFDVLKEEQLRAIFPGCEVKSATVARNPYSRRSKGYAFVDFVDHETQQRALKEFQGKMVEGRELTIKVAMEDLDRKKRIEEREAAEKKTAEAATSGAADAAAPAAPAAEGTTA